MNTLKDLITESELRKRFKQLTTKSETETKESFFLDDREIYWFVGRDSYWNNMRLYDTHWDNIKTILVEALRKEQTL